MASIKIYFIDKIFFINHNMFELIGRGKLEAVWVERFAQMVFLVCTPLLP